MIPRIIAWKTGGSKCGVFIFIKRDVSFYGCRRERGRPSVVECPRVSYHQGATACPTGPDSPGPFLHHAKDVGSFTTVPTQMKAIWEKTKESKTRRELRLEKRLPQILATLPLPPHWPRNLVLPTASSWQSHPQSNAS